MGPELDVRIERLALRSPFRISRGVKTHAEVVTARLTEGGLSGRGECVPYARYAETPEGVSAALTAAGAAIGRGAPAAAVAAAMPPGAARNALDCAVWDLRARQTGRPVAEWLGRPRPTSFPTAVTISLDAPAGMAAAARAVADAPLLKVKLDAEMPEARLKAVAAAAPNARLIVDPNESWTLTVLQRMADTVAALRVAVVEQPLPAEADGSLLGVAYPVPLCADESVHTLDDLPRVAERYAMVNVKLAKAGGLTHAFAMAQRARELGLTIMAGCMVASSLAIAPAMILGADADLADLDGPWWLAQDRAGGCKVERGVIFAPQPGFWGEIDP